MLTCNCLFMTFCFSISRLTFQIEIIKIIKNFLRRQRNQKHISLQLRGPLERHWIRTNQIKMNFPKAQKLKIEPKFFNWNYHVSFWRKRQEVGGNFDPFFTLTWLSVILSPSRQTKVATELIVGLISQLE